MKRIIQYITVIHYPMLHHHSMLHSYNIPHGLPILKINRQRHSNILNDPPHKISSKTNNFWMYYSQIIFGCYVFCRKNWDRQICVNRYLFVYISPSVLRSSMSISHRSHFLPVLTRCTSCISADSYWFNWRIMICTNGYQCSCLVMTRANGYWRCCS